MRHLTTHTEKTIFSVLHEISKLFYTFSVHVNMIKIVSLTYSRLLLCLGAGDLRKLYYKSHVNI